ncbi:MAG: hypothetical protein LBO69_06675 [Ignavibacteria bacterium]|jgi:hypothetical protein|nr:hypothetical protein [Ignavibacteria bacterium]
MTDQTILRIATCDAIKHLATTHNITQTDACRKFYNTVRKKHIPCGFNLINFSQFHSSFRRYKNTNKQLLFNIKTEQN